MTRWLRQINYDQKGSALIFTLMVTTILLVLAVSIISVTSIDAQTGSAQEKKEGSPVCC